MPKGNCPFRITPIILNTYRCPFFGHNFHNIGSHDRGVFNVVALRLSFLQPRIRDCVMRDCVITQKWEKPMFFLLLTHARDRFITRHSRHGCSPSNICVERTTNPSFIMKSKSFNAEKDEKLIRMVQSYPVLYDLSDKNYKNNYIKENVWKEISIAIGNDGTYYVMT